jgi:hypothetical protein
MERQQRWKNGHPAQQTTGVASANCGRRETLPSTQDCPSRTGIKRAIARTSTGAASAAPIQHSIVMPRSSAFCASSGLAFAVFSISDMAHLGQSAKVGERPEHTPRINSRLQVDTLAGCPMKAGSCGPFNLILMPTGPTD